MTDISKTEAAELWVSLRASFTVTTATIARIVETKAWEPLGYSSFREAWTEEVGLDEAMSPAVVDMVAVRFALEGAPDEEILSVKGVGPSKLRAVKVAARVGLDKPVLRRATQAALPGPTRRVSVDFRPEERERFVALSEATGSTLQREADKAIRAWFDRIEKRLSI